MNYPNGNTANYYNPNFNPPFNQGNPNFSNNQHYSNQGQGFIGNQGVVGQGEVVGNTSFNPFDLLGKRIWFAANLLISYYYFMLSKIAKYAHRPTFSKITTTTDHRPTVASQLKTSA